MPSFLTLFRAGKGTHEENLNQKIERLKFELNTACDSVLKQMTDLTRRYTHNDTPEYGEALQALYEQKEHVLIDIKQRSDEIIAILNEKKPNLEAADQKIKEITAFGESPDFKKLVTELEQKFKSAKKTNPKKF